MLVPVKCPICEGRGQVPPRFYYDSAGDDPKECRACDGKGVVRCWQSAPYVPAPYPVPVPQPYPVYPSPWSPLPTRPWIVWGTTTTTSACGDVDVSYGTIRGDALND